MMKNVPALEQIKQVAKESFFQSQLELFWLDYQNSDENRKFEKWDGRDSFKVYYSHQDILDPSKMGYYEMSLTRNIQKKIKDRFDALQSEIRDYELVEKKSSKDLVSNIRIDLEEVGKEIQGLKIPSNYRNIINAAFEHHAKLLGKKGSKVREKKKTWEFIYRPEVENEAERFEDDGRLKDFFKRLQAEEFIDSNTRFIHFHQLFSNRVPGQKIKWTKEGPAELVTIIKLLEERGFVKVRNQWSAVRESFITKFPTTNLHSATPVTKTKVLEKITDIVNELII